MIFRCDRCSHITKSEKALERHKMKHIPKSERIFSCASCPKTFTSKENLKSHERVHIPLFERYNYECDICGNKYGFNFLMVLFLLASFIFCILF